MKKKPDTKKKSTTEPSRKHSSSKEAEVIVPVVGIGASAGGLDAFRALLKSLPVDTGMAFVLIQHLDPKHVSMLPALLGEYTGMPVVEVKHGMQIEPNHVYVIAPDSTLALHHGRLQVFDRILERGRHLPVDYFFNSLADDLGNKAIGVVCSGTASDGTLGLKAIKAGGGITFAQDEPTAEYFGMPGSAIAAGCVDFVMPPKSIAKEVGQIALHPFQVHRKDASESSTPEAGENFDKIFLLLRSQTGNDFTYYKRNTILRRVKRRMMVHKLGHLRDYVRYLQATPKEIEHLFHDLLINVTGFFRDPEAFDALKEKVLARMLKECRPGVPLRIWIPGCSTGEEAYSVAISFLEQADLQNNVPQVQIFATDIDDRAIEIARSGIYPESIVGGLSQGRLRRHFVKVSGGYQINKSIREMCVFATQNLIKDPPFSKLDLICCRNLMIYLGSVLQKKTLQVFHYALNPNGFLMLGTSESVGGHAGLFSAVDVKNKLYSKKSISTRINYEFELRTAGMDRDKLPTQEQGTPLPEVTLKQEADRLVLDRYGPPGVVINSDMNIRSFRGETGPYLNPTPGSASLNLLKLVRQELLVDLRAAVHRALKEQLPVRKEGLCCAAEEEAGRVDIVVLPIMGPKTEEPCLLVLFEEAIDLVGQPGPAPGETEGRQEDLGGERIKALEQELASTREYMQSIIEEQDGKNEDMRSASEEIQSANEELQSTNEELETAKEELQSTNEELATVNEELENRNSELSAANNDFTNLLASVNLPILMLGHDLTIHQFTPQAEKLLNLIASDLGRPIGNIKPNIEIPGLERSVLEVIDSMTTKVLEVRDKTGHWYSVRMRPYRTLDNRIEGAVIAFIDIDMVKDMSRLRSALERERRLATVVRDANDGITVLDLAGNILAWNPAAERIYGYTEAEALHMNIERLMPKEEVGHFRQVLATLRKGVLVDAFKTNRITKSGSILSIWFNPTVLSDESGLPYGIATTERDVSKIQRPDH